MEIYDSKTIDRLIRLVRRVSCNDSQRDDLMQEALVHLWQIQQLKPDQTESWYLQSCRFHLQHHLALGRSIDSLKRSSGRVHPATDGDDHDSVLENHVNARISEDALAEVSARDMVTAMSKCLPEFGRTILELLAYGFGVSEIAQRLNISHPTVINHRRRIATVANRLGISSFAENQRRTGASDRKGNGKNVMTAE